MSNSMIGKRGFGVIYRVPFLQDYIEEVALEGKLKEVGEYVKAGDSIAEFSVDKIWFDIEAEHDGVITKYFDEEYGWYAVGAPVFEIDTDTKVPA